MNRITIRSLAVALTTAAVTIAAPSLFAQSGSPLNGFSIGPRYSNYSTRVDGTLTSGNFNTGRQHAFGLVGEYRNSGFVLDFQYDYDTSDQGISSIFVDVSDYHRSRGELAVGYAVIPSALDIEGGVRLENVRLGGFALFGNSIGSDLDMDHQAIFGGIKVHSATDRPAGFYLLGRAYVGTAKFNQTAADDLDTTGYRGELGVPIALGESNWHIVPGVEYEHIQTQDFGAGRRLRLNTNRFFLNFVVKMR